MFSGFLLCNEPCGALHDKYLPRTPMRLAPSLMILYQQMDRTGTPRYCLAALRVMLLSTLTDSIVLPLEGRVSLALDGPRSGHCVAVPCSGGIQNDQIRFHYTTGF